MIFTNNVFKNNIKRIVFLFMLFLSLGLIANPAGGPGGSGGGSGGGDPNQGGDPDAPIDGGITLLAAAGVAYGIKKVSDKRKQKSL